MIRRSIWLYGRKTTISLEDAFWTEFKKIAHDQSVTLSSLIGAIKASQNPGNLSSAIRVFVLEHFRNKEPSAGLPPSNDNTISADKGQSPQAWRGFARRR